MRFLLSAAAVATVLASLGSGAEARPRAKTYFVAPVIYGRSFLDSGNVVAPGSQPGYAAQATTLNQNVVSNFRPDSFGGSVLPERFSSFGRQQPVARFYTPAY